jgi:hypothetical protein
VKFVVARVSRRQAGGLALVLAGSLALFACSSSATSGPGSSTTARRYLLNATLADNGGLLSVQPGYRLKVVLPSSAWVFQPSQYPRVVRRTSGGGVTPATACHAGKGCGSMTAYFEMAGKGNVIVSATCTQQALCAGEPASFALRIDVT